jgi:hypothetical protein
LEPADGNSSNEAPSAASRSRSEGPNSLSVAAFQSTGTGASAIGVIAVTACVTSTLAFVSVNRTCATPSSAGE